ncbi:MAG: type IV pilus secretin PilQ [Pseudomonadota bacterium]
MNPARLIIKAIVLATCIAFSLISCGTSKVTQTADLHKVPGQPAAGPVRTEPQLTGVKAEPATGHTRIVLQGNQPMIYTGVMQAVPLSIVLDVGAKFTPGVLGLTTVNRGAVNKIEVEPVDNLQNMIRVKIELNRETTYKVVREGSDLVVQVDDGPGGREVADDGYALPDVPLTAAQMTGPTSVTAVDFKPLGTAGRTRLVIRTTKLVTPNISTKDGGQTVVLSVSPAGISSHLLRPLNTEYFRSAVDYVRAARATGDKVDFYIKLREVVPYHLGQKGLYTYIDFDASAREPKKTKLPEPGTPAAPTAGKPGEVKKTTVVDEKKVVTAPGLETDKVYTGRKISLDFQNADVHNILRLIATVSGKNIVVSDKVKGKITLQLSDVPWDQALDIVLASQDLGKVEQGNVIRIDLASGIRAQIQAQLKEEKDEAERVKEIPLEKKIFTPKYAAVADMEKELKKLSSKRGSVTVIGNDVYVADEPLILEQTAEVFQKYDKVARQILIESRIVEASTSFTKRLGVNWGGDAGVTNDPKIDGTTWNIFGLHNAGAAGAGGPAVNLISPQATGLAIGFGLTNTLFNLEAQLFAMEQTGEGRIVSAPRILAQNDQEVYIKQGQSIPYEAAGTTTAPATISYNEAVLELRVKPHIEENGEIISMDIKITKDTPDYSRTVTNPPINKREAKTRLMLRNGDTVVIGGIIVDSKSKAVSRVPALHRVPFLGWLFKNYEVDDSRLELLIFLTSHIIPVKI